MARRDGTRGFAPSVAQSERERVAARERGGYSQPGNSDTSGMRPRQLSESGWGNSPFSAGIKQTGFGRGHPRNGK